ncbi:uncharacterized protein LOC103988799 isoform X1 [Musa acuminata AAA Group]|uniref:uncharacterized protein LOC103988799 isoform X1 n=2 Tax=Musa acuminata AAA Group TaxID=214697 RepID=UPI0031DF4DC4
MSYVPTLFSLCVKTITAALVHGNEHVEDILELPSELFDGLATNLPPLALQNMHELLERLPDSCGGVGFTNVGVDHGRKRKRKEDFNMTWKLLHTNRWPEDITMTQQIGCVATQDGCEIAKLSNQSVDWQQLYWEKHLQNCLDEAAETALLPSFDGYISDLTISDNIMDVIGHSGGTFCTCMNLSFHCNKFGQYIRYLRLQNVLCVAETCELLRDCKLQGLVFRRIISKNQVNGVCMHLNQHRQTLHSLEFIYSQIPPAMIDQIFGSIHRRDVSQTHGVRELHVKSSRIFDSKLSTIPAGLLSFISSGRDLRTVCFCDSKLLPKCAKMIFDVLLGSSSDVVTLEISENNLAGWLSMVDRKPLEFALLVESNVSLRSLRKLSLRGNNFQKEDAEDLHNILVHMPVLSSLDISDNAIMDDGIRSLIPYFVWAVEKSYPLSDIKLNNCNLSCTGVAELLRSLPTLKGSFSVAENNLGSSIAAPLAKFLASSSVRKLNIEDVELGTLGFQQLEDQIPKKMALQSINISKNRGGLRAAYFIVKLLMYSPSIAYINAGGNLMPPESSEVIYGALKQSQGKLETLDLGGNTQLCQSNYASRLTEFRLHGRPIVIVPLLPASSTPYDDDP